jgi:hypothetical protein
MACIYVTVNSAFAQQKSTAAENRNGSTGGYGIEQVEMLSPYTAQLSLL